MTAAVRIRARWRLNPSQRRAWESKDRWTAFLGGWGAGKTWLGARVHLRNVLANPEGVDALIFAPFWATLRRTTLRAFVQAAGKQLITGESKKDCYIEILGRRVYYGSADRPETLDGPTVGAVWGDEGRYVRREGWRVCMSRLRDKRARHRRGLITSTPGGEWLEDEFGTDKPNRSAVHASTRENARNLADGYVEDLEQSLSARAAKVFIDGEFGLLEGAVYDFDTAWHLIDWKFDPKLPVWLAWDFGFTRPAVLFLQPIPPGTILPPAKGTAVRRIALPGSWVVIDELVPECMTTEALAHEVRGRGYHIAGCYCDPAGDGTQTATGLTDVDVVRRVLGVQPRWVEHPRLRYIPNGVAMLGALVRNVRLETRLYVSRRLESKKAQRGVVKDFQRYRYPEKKDGKPVTDHPHKDGLHDHTMDALRYFAVNEAVRAAGGNVEAIQVR